MAKKDDRRLFRFEGLFTPGEFRLLLYVTHPDTWKNATEAQRLEATRLLITHQNALVKGAEELARDARIAAMPQTAADWARRKEEVKAERKAKRAQPEDFTF